MKQKRGITVASLAEYTRSEALKEKPRTKIGKGFEAAMMTAHMTRGRLAEFGAEFWIGVVIGSIMKDEMNLTKREQG